MRSFFPKGIFSGSTEARAIPPEPGAGLLKRLWIGLLSILPIEWLL
jgi:hypothetical protein